MTAQQVSRRSLLRGIGLATGTAAFGGALASCSAAGAGLGGSTDGIAFLTWDTSSGSPLHTVSENWAKSASKKIDIQSVPGGSDYEAKLRTVLASGAPPDVIRINDDYVKGYHAQGTLLDLKSYMDKDGIDPSDYFPVAFNFAKQADGAHAAWPIMTNPGVIYINTDAFKEAGVDLPPKEWSQSGWTWDDFLAAAKKLNKPGERYGALIFPDTALETVFPVNNGSDGIYSEDGTRFTLAEPQGTEAIQWVADLSLVHKVHPDFATVTAGDNTPNWALSQLANGKVAMMLGLTSGIPYLRENAKVEWDIVPTPMKAQRKTVNTLTVLAVPKDSKDPDTAWSFLKYCVGPEASKLLAESRGFMPVSKSAADLFVPDAKGPANLGMVTQALDNAVNENYSEYIEAARGVYRPVLDDVWSGKQTAAAALGSVEQKVNDILAGKGD